MAPKGAYSCPSDLQLALQTDFEIALLKKKTENEVQLARLESVLSFTKDRRVASDQIRQAKMIRQVVQKCLPNADDVDAPLGDDIKNVSKELEDFEHELGEFMGRSDASRQVVAELRQNFVTLYKQIESKFLKNDGLLKWNPQSYKRHLDAVRASCEKLEVVVAQFNEMKVPAMKDTHLSSFVTKHLQGKLGFDQSLMDRYEELQAEQKRSRASYGLLDADRSEVQIMEIEKSSLESGRDDIQGRLEGLKREMTLLQGQKSAINEEDRGMDGELRAQFLREEEEEHQRLRTMMSEVARSEGESGNVLKDTRAMYDDICKKLDQTLVAGPQDYAGCHFIFCMNSSESMKEGRWQQAKGAYRSFYDERLKQHQDDLVTLLTFAEQASCLVSGQPLQSVSHTKLDAITLDGDALFCPAWQRISRFAQDYKDPKRKNVVVFMTDGRADDTAEAAKIASHLRSLLESFGGMTLFGISLAGPDSGKLDDLVLAGNNGSQVFTGADERTYELAIDATNDTIVEAFRAIACCMSAREDQVKRKLDIVAEQRNRREKQFEQDRAAELDRMEIMLKKIGEISQKCQEGTLLTAEKRRLLLQDSLQSVEVWEEDVRSLMEKAEGELKEVETALANLIPKLESKKSATEEATAGLKRQREIMEQDLKNIEEQMTKAVQAKGEFQKNLGNSNTKALDQSVQIYLQVRQKQILRVQERYSALAALSNYLKGIADQLEEPLTNEFSDGTEAHLVLRYFKFSAGLTNLAGSQARAKADFRLIVHSIAQQVDGYDDMASAEEMIANEFNLKELCEPIDPKRSAKVASDRAERLMKRMTHKDSKVNKAHSQRDKAQLDVERAETKVEEAKKKLDEIGEIGEDADKKTEAKRDKAEKVFEKAEADQEAKQTALEEAEDALKAVICSTQAFLAAETLLKAIVESFKSTVHKEMMKKELEEVKENLEAIVNIFRGPVQTYMDMGAAMRDEFDIQVRNPTLEALMDSGGQAESMPVVELGQLGDQLSLLSLLDKGQGRDDSRYTSVYSASPRASVCSASPRATQFSPSSHEKDALPAEHAQQSPPPCNEESVVPKEVDSKDVSDHMVAEGDSKDTPAATVGFGGKILTPEMIKLKEEKKRLYIAEKARKDQEFADQEQQRRDDSQAA